MADKTEKTEKNLNKNYGAVQKKENSLADLKVNLAKEFAANTTGLQKTLNKEMKTHEAFDKAIKAKYKGILKEINANHLTHKTDIDLRVKSFELLHQEELKNSASKFVNSNIELDKLITAINKEYAKLVKDVNTQNDKDLLAIEKEKARLVKQGEEDIAKLLANLKDTQDKYENLVSNLNEKRDLKAEKLNTALAKKIEKTNSDIEKEQLKTDKNIADLKPTFDDNLTAIEDKIIEQRHKYQTKDNTIKSALESRVARHEKFLNKAISQKDNKSIKEHRKNISSLEKEAEKEDRLLQKEHNDKLAVLVKKKKELISANMTKTASFQTEFTKYKEDKLFQLELLKANLANDLSENILNTKQKLEDELNKYNVCFANNDREQAEVIKQLDLNLENQDHQQVNQVILFDKTNKINDIKHQEALASKATEVKAVELLKETEEAISKLALETELEKLKTENLIAEKELIESVKLNEENELIEYHKNDFNKQSSLNTEGLNHHSELSKLYNARALALSEYEELEVNNRFDLKVAFLQAQNELVSEDNKAIMKKVEQVFESEKAMFELEINKLAKSALDELEQFKTEQNEVIEKMIKKRNALDARAYKKEIRVLDREIADKKDDLKDDVKKKQKAINAKTAVYKKALEQAEVRKFSGLNEATSLFNNEQTRLNNSVDSLQKERANELEDIKTRLSSTNNDTNKYYSQAEERNSAMTNENTDYQNSRIEKEEAIIKEVKALFEKEKHEFNTALENALADLEKQKNNTNQEASNNKLKEEEALENKIKDFANQVNSINKTAEGLQNDQRSVNKSNMSKIESKYNDHLTKVTNEFKVKQENYKVKTVEVEKATNEKNKTFDASKKQAQKNYDVSLSSGLSTINQKLQQDLKKV